MPPVAEISHLSLVDIHEGRIQKLEESTNETAVAVTQINGRLNNMDTHVGTILTNIKEMGEKIDPLLKKVQRSEKDDAIRSALNQRTKWWKNTILALILAGGGAAMVKLGEAWVEWMVKTGKL